MRKRGQPTSQREKDDEKRRAATRNMKRENLKTSRIDFNREKDFYNNLLNLLDNLRGSVNSKNIQKHLSRPSVELNNFLREVDKLPHEEAYDLREAIVKNDFESVRTILLRYIDRFKRLVEIDERYHCTRLYQRDLEERKRDIEDKGNALNLAYDFWFQGKESNDANKFKIYHRLIHSDTCDKLYDRKPNNCRAEKNEMSQCLQRRICGHALVYNNIPENFDIGHCKQVKLLDCDKSMEQYQQKNEDLYESIHLRHKGKIEKCRVLPSIATYKRR